ncbi:MAG: MmcQ/YjbR family DNA-binding protein [Burkholderiaceae bacterium]
MGRATASTPVTVSGGESVAVVEKSNSVAFPTICVNRFELNYEEFNYFCSSLPASSYVVQWGDAHVWKVAGKVFAIGGWEKIDKPAFVFKASEADFNRFKNEPGYRPAPYMAARGMKWLQVYDSSKLARNELKNHLRESHRLVSLGLTKKKQDDLGLNQS